ncbi:MAG: CDP-alcohol phosphatidyltransferase family protein [Actinomycetota bacterium]|nr:CDP-alcohol phosphatidyltransferase family protein [Actinomycetota bacterium]
MTAGGSESVDLRREVPPGETSSLLTWPNLFTLLRLLCLPVFLYLVFGRDNRAGAAWLLGALGATDWVDGYLARRLGQVTEFGKVFDPVVDRLLLVVAIIAIIIDGAAPLWFVVAVLAREVSVSAAMVVATVVYGMKRFDVTLLGKTATFWLMFAVPGFMLGSSDIIGHEWYQLTAWILGIPGLVLSYYTAIAYVPSIRDGIQAGRRG